MYETTFCMSKDDSFSKNSTQLFNSILTWGQGRAVSPNGEDTFTKYGGKTFGTKSTCSLYAIFK